LLVQIHLKDENSAQRLAFLEVMAGVGTVFGPAFGGFLYEAGKDTGFGDISFALPCVVLSVIPMLTACFLLLPHVSIVLCV
jgi:hypothetical protein